MNKNKAVSYILSLVFAIFLAGGAMNILAQGGQSDEEISNRAGILITENVNLYRELSELISNEALINQAQPFPLELRGEVDGLIRRFLLHGDGLLALSETLSRRYSSASCANLLENLAEPAMAAAKEDYSATSQTAAHSSDRDMQLANLLGYQLLSATSFVKLHYVREALAVCSSREMSGF